MRQGYPYGVAVREKLDIHGIRVAGSNGDDQRFVNAVDLFLGPAVGGMEIAIHGCENYSGVTG
jgi:hypothetical protein